jgi:uncharacterized membrane protein YqjE
VSAESGQSSAASGSPRGIAARVAQLVATRVELLGFELNEERRAAVALLILLAAGVTLSLLAVIVLTAAVLLALPPSARAPGAALIGLAYAGGGAWFLLRVRRTLRERPIPFSATIDELRRDREWLESLK